jgi:hypothetical protein
MNFIDGLLYVQTITAANRRYCWIDPEISSSRAIIEHIHTMLREI